MKKFRYLFISAILGNAFEHYDKALFGFLSPFIAPLIFPEKDPLMALILTYAMIPLGMLARPIGSLVFGDIGDKYGRKEALSLSLSGMGIISFLIAFIPTYSKVGILVPIFFCLSRVLQNFFAAGESMGGAIYLLETTKEKKHDFLSSLFNSSTIGGILLASAAVSFLSFYDLALEGWRLLYLLGSITTLFGFIIRRKISEETFEISQLEQKNGKIIPIAWKNKGLLSFLKIFWEYRKPLFLIMITAGFAYANYSIALVLINGFIPLVTTISKSEMMHLNSILLILDFLLLPLFGILSSKISREKMMLLASLCPLITALPLFMFLQQASFLGVVAIRIFLVVVGVAFFAPYHAWARHLVPKEHRYTLISFGYAIGSQILGGPTAFISLWIFKTTGLISSIAWYWIGLSLLCSLCLLKSVYFPVFNKELKV